MERNYRHLWNEAGTIKGERYSEEVNSFYNGGISLKKGKLKAEDGKNENLYFTIELKESLFCHDELKDELRELIVSALGELLKKNNYKKGSRVLAIGLGNEKMTADSLGSLTVGGLQISRHILDNNPIKLLSKMPNISAIKSSVSGITGLKSFDIITGVIEKTKPDFVIAIDTLACKGVSRLARAVQLSDEGIEPGGGVNNAKTKLDIESLGIPVIAIGVPFVIYVRNIIKEYMKNGGEISKTDEYLHSLVVTAKDIDMEVYDYAYVISSAINKALNKF